MWHRVVMAPVPQLWGGNVVVCDQAHGSLCVEGLLLTHNESWVPLWLVAVGVLRVQHSSLLVLGDVCSGRRRVWGQTNVS